jgi:hypothetical protein
MPFRDDFETAVAGWLHMTAPSRFAHAVGDPVSPPNLKRDRVVEHPSTQPVGNAATSLSWRIVEKVALDQTIRTDIQQHHRSLPANPAGRTGDKTRSRIRPVDRLSRKERRNKTERQQECCHSHANPRNIRQHYFNTELIKIS